MTEITPTPEKILEEIKTGTYSSVDVSTLKDDLDVVAGFRNWYDKYENLSDDELRKVVHYNFRLPLRKVQDMKQQDLLDVVFEAFPSIDDLKNYANVISHEKKTYSDLYDDKNQKGQLYQSLELYTSDLGFRMNWLLYAIQWSGDQSKIPDNWKAALTNRRAIQTTLDLLNLFEIVPRTTKDIVAWSGRDKQIQKWKERKVGDIYTANGFFSMSLNFRNITAGYLDFEVTPACCLMEVFIPAGTRVLFAPSEEQLVLPPLSRFRITKIATETFLSGWGGSSVSGNPFTVDTFHVIALGNDPEETKALKKRLKDLLA